MDGGEKRKIVIRVKEPPDGKYYFEYKLKKSTKLRKLMDAHCKPIGLRYDQVRFFFKEKRILPTDTAWLLAP